MTVIQPTPDPSNEPLSFVAGVLQIDGGVRTVVTNSLASLEENVAKGERFFIVPDLLVREPVEWNAIPFVVNSARKAVLKSLHPENLCGNCNACCITPYIDDVAFKKPSGKRCPNLCAEGCATYWKRPEPCRGFECMWLQSQRKNDVMPPELRPDRCGCYFIPDTTTNDPLIIEVHGEPNADAWKWINLMQAAGFKARKITSYEGEES